MASEERTMRLHRANSAQDINLLIATANSTPSRRRIAQQSVRRAAMQCLEHLESRTLLSGTSIGDGDALEHLADHPAALTSTLDLHARDVHRRHMRHMKHMKHMPHLKHLQHLKHAQA